MAKKILLTYKLNGRRIEDEECLLLDDEDKIFFAYSEEPLTIVTDDGVGNVVGTIAGGMVMFEDEMGMFGVPPEDVIHIEVL